MQDEILIKGTDGQWYLLKGEELVPYIEARTARIAETARTVELPKGVDEERHERLEKTEDRRQKTEIVGAIRLPSSVFRPLASYAEHPIAKEREELVDRVVQEAPRPALGISGDEVLRKRFRTIVSARLRDVRDSAETRAMLMRDQKVGGMGWGRESGVEQIMQIIEKAWGEFQKKWKETETRRMDEWRKAQRQRQDQRQQQEQLKSQQALEERYKKIVGKKETAPKVPPAAPPLPPSVPPPPKPAPPPLPTPSLPSKPSSKITDVRTMPKQLGPLQELGSITLEDFRRLPGSSASERAQKVLSRIEFLGRESLARRAQGISAWRASPLSRLYASVLSGALSRGVSPEVALQDQPDLTEEEFRGIMEMNMKLRF